MTAVLIAAAIGLGTIAAAAATHVWTQSQPVAIPVLPGSHQVDDGNTLDIPDPERIIASAAEFESAVAEFAPSIRLPEGLDFSAWVQHVACTTDFTTNDGLWRRFNVAGGMVFIAECQWGQRWLDASRAGDSAAMNEPIEVLGTIGDWSRNAGLDIQGYVQDLVRQMKNGETIMLQQWLGVNCGNTGSVVGAPNKLDGLAQDLLTGALTTAQRFRDANGTYSGFSVPQAEELAPAFAWAAPDWVPAAGPGEPNIAVADDQRLVLTAESETGAIFCIEVQPSGTTYGLVQPGSGIGAGVVCEVGGWQGRRASLTSRRSVVAANPRSTGWVTAGSRRPMRVR